MYMQCYTITTRPVLWNAASGFDENGTDTFCHNRKVNTEMDEKKVPLREGDKVSEIKCVSQEDVNIFSQLTGDHNPIHKMPPGALNDPAIVHGALLNGLISGVIGTKLPGPGTMVVSQILHFPNPCYTGEQVVVTVEITSVRKLIACKFSCTVDRKSKVTVLHGEAKLIPIKNFSA
jgi:acyl dehydratase